MKVYLVWQRDYGDTLIDSILKVFDSEEKAVEYCRDFDEDEGVWWEERIVE